MQLMMLDPRSDMARFRAQTDQRDWIREHGYVASAIFQESYDVIRRMKIPTPDWCLEEELIDRIKNQIEVRLYDSNPVVHLIILSQNIFVEPYHNGGGKPIRDSLMKFERYSNLPNYAGLAPVFLVKRDSLYAEVMISHFDNLWEAETSAQRSLNSDQVYTELFDFVEDQWSKRAENGCL